MPLSARCPMGGTPAHTGSCRGMDSKSRKKTILAAHGTGAPPEALEGPATLTAGGEELLSCQWAQENRRRYTPRKFRYEAH